MSKMTTCIEMSKTQIDALKSSQLDEYIEKLKNAQGLSEFEKNIKLALAYMKKDFIDEAAYHLQLLGDTAALSQLAFANNSVAEFAKFKDTFSEICCEGCCECSANCCCDNLCDNCDCDCDCC